MEDFKNKWVDGVHYDVIPQSEISKINKKISEDSTLNVNYKPARMYSEEEMLQALSLGFTSTDETWEQCVAFAKEQFKKK